MARKPHTYHYIYKTTCKVNDKFYIGMHSTSNLEDGYIGSGKRLWNSIRKYGRENHEFEILEWFPDRSSLKEREKEIVNEGMLQDPMCMNLQLGGGGGGFINEDHRKKAQSIGGSIVFRLLNTRHLEKLKNDSEYKLNFSKSISNAVSGEKNPFYGRSHSKESRDKISKSCSLKQSGEKNSQYGSKWIHNEKEKINKKIHKDEFDCYINSGWKPGRKMNFNG